MTSPTPPHQTADEPDTAGPRPQQSATAPRPRSKMRGNWRSLLLSMAAVGAVVLVLYSIVPRPDAVTQPAVDVTPVAQQLEREAGMTVWTPRLGEPGKAWKATSVRYETEPVPGWYVGYHRTDDQQTFVAIRQIAASAPADARSTWVDDAVAHGRQDGVVHIDGATWTRYTTGGDPARRGLVGEVGGLPTVVSGLADDATLQSVVRSLRPYKD